MDSPDVELDSPDVELGSTGHGNADLNAVDTYFADVSFANSFDQPANGKRAEIAPPIRATIQAVAVT